MSDSSEQSPHQDLYTRLGPVPDRGIGVIAIRDITVGTNPFQGDAGKTVRVPIAEVEAIADPDLRRMYVDFCPTHEGAHIAPVNLNLLTISWYMNHSDEPNIASDRDMNFSASRTIRKGEELTVDYTRYSDGAQRRIREWTSGN